VVKTDITDNYFTVLVIDYVNKINRTIFSKQQKLKIGFVKLNNLLSNLNWDELLNTKQVDKAMLIFNSEIKCVIDTSSNLIGTYKRKYIKLKNWITKGILVSIRKREQFFAVKNKRPFDQNFCKFCIKYRNLLQLLIKKSRNLYYQEKINSVHGNMKETWNLINEATGRKKRIIYLLIVYVVKLTIQLLMRLLK